MAGIRASARNKAERKLDSIYANETEMDKIIGGDKPKGKAGEKNGMQSM